MVELQTDVAIKDAGDVGMVDSPTVEAAVSFTVVSAFAVQSSEALPIRPADARRAAGPRSRAGYSRAQISPVSMP